MITLLALAMASPPEVRFAVGGESNRQTRGIIDVGVRGEDWSFELLTDTLAFRAWDENDRGRAWWQARLELLGAGLFFSPWTDGAPDLDRAQGASYVGVDAGSLRYFSHGLYAGATADLRFYEFTAIGDRPTRDPALVLITDLVGGYHSDSLRMWGRVGLDIQDEGPGAHAAFEGVLRPDVVVGPIAELRLRGAVGQTDITVARVGGLNPYVVPLAGAAWAEFWEDDYVAVRAGMRIGRNEGLSVEGTVDGVVLANRTESGYRLALRWARNHWTVDVAAGLAPDLFRADGRLAGAGYVRIARDWLPGRKHR